MIPFGYIGTSIIFNLHSFFLQNNVFGLIGPTTKASILHIQSISDFLEMPHIIFEPIEIQNRNWSAINLYPNHIAYSQVIKIKIFDYLYNVWKPYTKYSNMKPDSAE